MNPPLGVALTHTPAHPEICDNSTFGASRPRTWIERRWLLTLPLLTPLCCVEENTTNISSSLLIFSSSLMGSRLTRIKRRKLLHNWPPDGLLRSEVRYLLSPLRDSKPVYVRLESFLLWAMVSRYNYVRLESFLLWAMVRRYNYVRLESFLLWAMVSRYM